MLFYISEMSLIPWVITFLTSFGLGIEVIT
jgi:hypothetical protein